MPDSPSTKITGLTPQNVSALDETLSPRLVTTTATTATFHNSPEVALHIVEETIARLPGRGHPRASLHAVARKLRKQL